MAGFMAGFGTKLSELIEEDRKYYRDAAAKRRDYIQTYGTRAVTDRENKANAAKGVYNYLISNDISEEDARYVLNTSGVQGLAQLKATIDSRTDLTADERSKLVKKAKDYVDENPDEDINSVLKRAYGLYKSTDNPVKRERSMFASMLGLDSRMMEDEVLDDMYINGYSGRDIYRIMGSAEAQTGAALDLDLPTKPPSPTVLNNTAKFLESQFDTSIDSRISSVEQLMLTVDKDGTEYSDLNDERTKLENLKAKGLLALGEYAAAYDPALFDFARAQEEALPGSITRNSYLFEFLPAYQTHFEEAKDEDKLAAAGAGKSETQEPKGDGKVDEPPKKTTHKVTSEAEALELITSGKVKIGDDIDINGTIRPVENLPESVAGPGPSVPFDLSLDGLKGDRSSREDVVPSFSSNVTPETVAKVEQAFDPVVADEKELTVEDQAEQRYDAVQSTIDDTKQALGEAVIGTAEVLDDINAIGDRAAVKAKWAVGTRIATGMGAIAQYLGYEDLAKGWYQWSIKNQDRGSSSPLLTQQINDMLDVLGVPDFSEGVNLPEKDRTAQELVTEIFDDVASMSDEEKAAKVEELKAVAAKYKESKKDTSMEDRIKDDARQFIQDEKSYPQPLDRIVIDTEQDVETMEDRIRDDARQFLQDEKSFPQPLPTVVIDDLADGVVDVVQKLIKNRQAPSERDVKALKNRLKSSQYRGPISDKTLKEKLDDIYNFYTQEEGDYNPRAIGTVGSRDLGLRDTTDDVRPPRSEEPDAQTKTRPPLGDTRTDADPTLPASMTVEQMTTRGKKARPSGLMSPPSSGTAPKLGQAEFGDLIDRVHGSSKAAEAFNNKVSSGKVTAADVTRLIKATRKLPNTKSKDTLLQSLFDLRDALNKR